MKIPKKVLIIVPRRIGDVLLATPLIRSMRNSWPDARIDVLIFENSQEIINANPDIDRIITIPENPRLAIQLGLPIKLFKRYDLAATTQSGDRAVFYAFIGGISSAGIIEENRKEFWKRIVLTKWIQLDDLNTHTVLMNLKIADLLGINRCYEVVVSWNPRNEEKVIAKIPFDIDSTPFAVLHIYPKFPYKQWHLNGWIDLAKWFLKQGLRVVFTGGKSRDEINYIRRCTSRLPRYTVNMAGQLSLGEVGYLLSKARLYVGPDTSVTHIAASTGVPVIALFGPSNPVKWGPWPYQYSRDTNPYRHKGSQTVKNVTILQGDMECVPCRKEGCDRHINSLSNCLQNIEPATVIATIQNVLDYAFD
jgi:heptosyltransferase-3